MSADPLDLVEDASRATLGLSAAASTGSAWCWTEAA